MRPPFSREWRKNISRSHIGHRHSEETLKKMRARIPWNKGKKDIYSKETLEKISKSGKGRKWSVADRLSKSATAPRGSDHHNWKGGVTPKYERIRRSIEYKLWRKSVFERDNHTCVWCGYKSHKKINGKSDIEADHIKPFSLFPALRFAIDNGRTLCVPCHRRTDTWGFTTKK